MGRVVRLSGAAPEAIELAIDPLPAGAPAIVTYRAAAAGSPAGLVEAILRELEQVAIEVFPAWLPDAQGIETSGGAAVPAVRALALRLGAGSSHFGPFLADLAEQALRRRGGAPRFSPEVRVVGLARVLAASFGRSRTALLVHVPDDLSPAGEEVLVAAGEWLANHGGLGVWLSGAPLTTVDRVSAVTVALTADLASLAGPAPGLRERGRAAAVTYPAVAGLPHPSSPSERALEAALAPCSWAAGRGWNQTYQSHPLANPIRLDLWWPVERCVVEVDGPEHCAPPRFASDRRRDVRLQLDGFAVLRFTNDQVADDVTAVVSQIEQLLRARRLGTLEGQRDAEE